MVISRRLLYRLSVVPHNKNLCMNYFAHGIRFLERPYFLAGTAVPDWLSVVDRRVRMRPRSVSPFADGTGSECAEVAAGVLQHLEDDRWFHETRAFVETMTEMGRLFRQLLGPEDGFRPGFLGHIVTELLLDRVLIEERPHLLDRYYARLQDVDPLRVQECVNAMARGETHKLSQFIPLFLQSEFLRDYLDSKALLRRLNQVMQRIKLKRLPDETEEVLVRGRTLVRARACQLLPVSGFPV